MPRVVLQDLNHGRCWLEEAATPAPGPNEVLIATRASVVSAGTERMLADFGRANLVGKARRQPERVVEVVDKARTDGVGATVNAVRSKLGQPIGLGYSSAGVVLETGAAVTAVAPGDVVAAAGPHAEVAAVPVNLTAPVPDGIDPAHAAFATVGSIALQGLRLAEPTMGERFVVTGLGLIGLLAVQLLRANGCTVLGIDPDPDRRARAEAYGARTVDSNHDVVATAADLSDGIGVDGVIICATTTSDEPVHQAAQMCRQRGRIVLVGVTGLELQRSDFYEKELSFQVSASYGPGRHDPTYVAGGVDYPPGFVRWTAGRNMSAVLDAIATGRIDAGSLITHEHPFDDAPAAYDTLVSDPTALGIVLDYPEPDLSPTTPLRRTTVEITPQRSRPAGTGQIGVLGAGTFATQVLLPAIAAADGQIRTIVSRGGTSAALAAERFDAERSSTDPAEILDDPAIDTVVIATRHDSHARYVEQSLRAGKHTYVEKPLAITCAELDSLRSTVDDLSTAGTLPILGVGFNRRFAPITRRMSRLLATQHGPKALVLTMNAGALPADHWLHDPTTGGGRIVGEACHLIDLARFLVGAPIVEIATNPMGHEPAADTTSISLSFDDGSIATINYFSNGSKRYPKERIEVFTGGRVLVNDNHRALKAYGWPRTTSTRRLSQDKGHQATMAAFLDAVRTGGPPPIPLDELFEVTEITLRAAGND